MPNTFAFLVLLAWPVVVVILFRRLPPGRALIWSILGGYLLLPPVAAFDLPMVPALDKATLPNLTAFLCVLFLVRQRVALLPQSGVGKALLLLFVFSPVATALTNPEPILFHAAPPIPGLTIHDSFSMVANQALLMLPMFLARQLLATEEAIRDLLRALLVAALAYSLPTMVELRMSPQINIWVYGFFQHDFSQMMRGDGFRPLVFLPHALWHALFYALAILATLTLARAAPPEVRPKYMLAAGFLFVLLVLCKSLAAIAYVVALAPIVLFAPRRVVVLAAMLCAALVLTFPILRGTGLFPTEALVDLATRIDPVRAYSLYFRFANEDVLLAHAAEKWLFGWGEWMRNLVHDPWSGRVLTISDGRWVIVIGVLGWTGYIVEFGLLTLPIFLLARAGMRLGWEAVSPLAAGLALMLSANLIDLLPNATLEPLTWLLAGALLGHAEALVRQPRPRGAANRSLMTDPLRRPAGVRTLL